MIEQLTFTGGLLLGLASTLHCAAMCGPVALGLDLLRDGGQGEGARWYFLLLTQLGKGLGYVGAGAVLGALGSEFYGLFDREAAFMVLQWAAACCLVGIGLSVAGLLPAIAWLDRLAAPVGRLVARLGKVGRSRGERRWLTAIGLRPLLLGLVWGLMPCGMVYAALFLALLSGSAGAAALVMAGFALGTMPAVTASAFGLGRLTRLAHRDRLRLWAGGAIALCGVLGLVLSAPGGPLCISN